MCSSTTCCPLTQVRPRLRDIRATILNQRRYHERILSHDKLFEIKVYWTCHPIACFMLGEVRGKPRVTVPPMSRLPARIDRPIGPFASADAAWDYVGDGNGLGMSDVDELTVFMWRLAQRA
jgi:hypothetical protein